MIKRLVIALLLVSVYGCGGPKKLFDTESQYLEPVPLLYQLAAHSSIRYLDAELTFFNSEHAEYREHGIITILDEEHRSKGRMILDYDQFRKLETMNLQVRNSAGEIVGVYTIKDAEDYSASGGSFFTDVRMKVLEGYHYSYPYTLEYEYKYRYSATLNLPGWYPKSYDQSLEKATFTITDFSNGNVRYHSRNLDAEPDTIVHPGYTQTRWNLSTELARKYEPYSPPYPEIFPNVLTSATNFKVANSSGSAASWESFGKWYYELSHDKKELPQMAKDEVDKLLEGITDEEEKVKRLYKYMQDQMRYVSIQLGLGGWEPYSAEFVYQNKYGDCKALVNFMQALLEYVGIEARPVLIGSGLRRPSVIPDFPSNQFNHVVLWVQLSEGSEMWLECTSKYMKPGRLGADNEGKYALIVNETGGKLVTTRISEQKENELFRLTNITLANNGSAIIHTTLNNQGAMDDNMLHQLRPLSEKKREEWLEKSIDLNDFKVQTFSFSGLDDDLNQTGYELELQANNYASSSSKRLFVPVNQLNQWSIYIPGEDSRTTSIRLPYRFSEVDSTIFILPEGFRIESLPENKQVENNFGRFTLSIKRDAGKVLLKRELVIFQREIDTEDYNSFRDFFTTVNKSDREQFVIVNEM